MVNVWEGVILPRRIFNVEKGAALPETWRLHVEVYTLLRDRLNVEKTCYLEEAGL